MVDMALICQCYMQSEWLPPMYWVPHKVVCHGSTSQSVTPKGSCVWPSEFPWLAAIWTFRYSTKHWGIYFVSSPLDANWIKALFPAKLLWWDPVHYRKIWVVPKSSWELKSKKSKLSNYFYLLEKVSSDAYIFAPTMKQMKYAIFKDFIQDTKNKIPS